MESQTGFGYWVRLLAFLNFALVERERRGASHLRRASTRQNAGSQAAILPVALYNLLTLHLPIIALSSLRLILKRFYFLFVWVSIRDKQHFLISLFPSSKPAAAQSSIIRFVHPSIIIINFVRKHDGPQTVHRQSSPSHTMLVCS